MWKNEDASKLDIEEVWQMYRDYLNPSQVELIGSFPFGRELVKEASGCWIILTSGKRILDLTGGIGVLNHGHNHPRILQARKNFADQMRMEVHKNFLSPYLAILSANVAELMPGDLQYSYFPNSGAEAVEGAVKLAYKYHDGSRNFILHSDISFHGKLLGAAGLTGSPEIAFKFPTIPNVETFEYNNIISLKEKIDLLQKQDGTSNIYAIILEPLNASSMRSCSSEFILELRRLCDVNDIILIFDEVYSGWGKTGYLFNFMRVQNVIPDIVTYAKSFGGGKASISGYTSTQKVASAYHTLSAATLHSTTYNGFGEETVTAIEALNILVDEKLVEKSKQIGIQFKELANELLESCQYIEEIRGSGALWGIVFKRSAIEKVFAYVAKTLSHFNLLDSGIVNDPRFAKKLIAGSIVNSLYIDFGILTYFGVNIENPLIISFPLVTNSEEFLHAEKALRETFEKPLAYHVVRFIKTRYQGPKSD
jgi:putrescine aminotransferase